MPPLPVRARLNGVQHWETRHLAASARFTDREGMYMTSTSPPQLLRHIPRGEAESRSDALAGVQDAASPSKGVAQRCSPLGDAASCRVSLVHGARRNVHDSHDPFATPEAAGSRLSQLVPPLGAPSPSPFANPWRARGSRALPALATIHGCGWRSAEQ